MKSPKRANSKIYTESDIEKVARLAILLYYNRPADTEKARQEACGIAYWSEIPALRELVALAADVVGMESPILTEEEILDWEDVDWEDTPQG